MKKFLLILPLAVCALFMNACSNPTASKEIPPAPKPDNYIDTAAVAAKKADFYVRLAFDLADGYLSNDSVVRKRYGRDNKYVNSLEFAQASITGNIFTSHISAPLFQYWRYDEYGVSEIILYDGINNPNLYTNELKRTFFIGQATGATLPSYQYDIQFRKTDIAAVADQTINLSMEFTQPGLLTAKGAKIITPSFGVRVADSSGVSHNFNVTLNNVAGAVKGVSGTISSYTPSPESEFVINGGQIIITGADTSVHPVVGYTITLDYSNDAVENKTGNFKSSDGNFTANYTITKNESYYSKIDDLTRKHYVYWDYPL